MQRLQNAYTKYINTRYGKSGHLFQGPYKSKHIADDRYLMHVSAYIHKNPTELSSAKNYEDTYYWSSFQDCIAKNRFPQLLVTDILTQRLGHNKKVSYKNFVKTSSAKELLAEVGDL
jgi:hypothetical protein